MVDKLLSLAALDLLTVKVLPPGMGGLGRTLFPTLFIRSHPVHGLVWGLNMGTCESLTSLYVVMSQLLSPLVLFYPHLEGSVLEMNILWNVFVEINHWVPGLQKFFPTAAFF